MSFLYFETTKFSTTLLTSLIAPFRRLICLFLLPIQYDQDYHPGRRKRGKDYKEGMVKISCKFFVYFHVDSGEIMTLITIVFCSMSFRFIIQDK